MFSICTDEWHCTSCISHVSLLAVASESSDVRLRQCTKLLNVNSLVSHCSASIIIVKFGDDFLLLYGVHMDGTLIIFDVSRCIDRNCL